MSNGSKLALPLCPVHLPMPNARNAKREIFPGTLHITILGTGAGPAQGLNTPLARLRTAGQVKAGLAHHPCKVGLAGEAFDGLDEVLVRVPIAGQDLSKRGNYVEGVLTVDPARCEREKDACQSGHRRRSCWHTRTNALC